VVSVRDFVVCSFLCIEDDKTHQLVVVVGYLSSVDRYSFVYFDYVYIQII
jgi:hypothetical protein